MLIKQYAFILIAVIFTTACSLTENIPFFKDTEETKEHKRFTGDPLDNYSDNEQKRLVNRYIDEWETLRPSINKVIALESELSFALKAIEETNVSDENSVMVTELQSIPEALLEPQVMQNKFSNTNNIIGNKPSQAVIPNNNYEASVDAKFANDTSSAQVELGIAKPVGKSFENPNEENKFSQPTPLQQNVLANIQCGEHRYVANGEQYAVHLASYTKKDNASSGQKSFANKYKNELCAKMAVIKSVEVKGNNYYSLRFGPYLSSKEAKSMCSVFQEQNDYCTVSRFDGESIN